MTEIVSIVVDNGMQSQNQDYSPSRFVLQIDITSKIISHLTSENVENKIGIITLAQGTVNDIITPTSEKQNLLTYAYRIDLEENSNLGLAIYQVEQSFELSELTTKKLIIFLSSTISDPAQTMYELSRLEDKGILVKLVCFGDALEFGLGDAQALTSPSFLILNVFPEDDFDSAVEEFLLEDGGDDDLKEAIRRSKIEQ